MGSRPGYGRGCPGTHPGAMSPEDTHPEQAPPATFFPSPRAHPNLGLTVVKSLTHEQHLTGSLAPSSPTDRTSRLSPPLLASDRHVPPFRPRMSALSFLLSLESHIPSYAFIYGINQHGPVIINDTCQ